MCVKQVGCFHVHISQLSWELSFTVAVLMRQNAKMQACVCAAVRVQERERDEQERREVSTV